MFFFDFFNHYTKEWSSKVVQPTDSSTWPEEWKKTYFKTYERFPSFELPKPVHLDCKLIDTIVARRSGRTFGHEMTKEQLSTLLYYGCGETQPNARSGAGYRAYPSGGARYPVETYLLLFRPVDDLVPGVYHYAVDGHRLSLIYEIVIDRALRETMVKYDFLEQATGAFLFTGVLSRATAKYKEHAYRFAVLESGIIAENISLVSTALGIDSVMIGMLSADVVEELLDIDGTDETFIHSMFFG